MTFEEAEKKCRDGASKIKRLAWSPVAYLAIDVSQPHKGVALHPIRLEMAKLGWESEDRLTKSGWKDGPGYSIWFRRRDWHGWLAANGICFHWHTPDPAEADKAIEKAAVLAKEAWEKFGPDQLPTQSADGKVIAENKYINDVYLEYRCKFPSRES